MNEGFYVNVCSEKSIFLCVLWTGNLIWFIYRIISEKFFTSCWFQLTKVNVNGCHFLTIKETLNYPSTETNKKNYLHDLIDFDLKCNINFWFVNIIFVDMELECKVSI